MHIVDNKEDISTRISTLLDNVKVRLEKVLRCNIILNNKNIAPPPEEIEKDLELDEQSNNIIEIADWIENEIQQEESLEVIPCKKQKKNHREKMLRSKGTDVRISFLTGVTRTKFN